MRVPQLRPEIAGTGPDDLILPGAMRETLTQVVAREKPAGTNVIRRR